MKKLLLILVSFCITANTFSQLNFNNGNVGINFTNPVARLHVFQTGPVTNSWGSYPYPSRVSLGVIGSHVTVGDNYDAIGVAGYANNASGAKNNVGILATTGSSGANNIGMYAYQYAAFTGKVYGSLNDVTQNGGTGTAYGSYNSVNSSGNTNQDNYGVYATSVHTSTSPSPNTYALYGEAFTSGSANLSIQSYGVFGYAHGLGLNVGLYGKATGGNENYALYAQGKSYFTDNVGIGISSPSVNLHVAQFTKLGNDAPAIKMVKLTGTTAATVGGNTQIAHGLTASKILSISLVVDLGAAGNVMENYTQSGGYQTGISFETTYVYVWNSPTNSANILNKPFKVLVTYEQ